MARLRRQGNPFQEAGRSTRSRRGGHTGQLEETKINRKRMAVGDHVAHRHMKEIVQVDVVGGWFRFKVDIVLIIADAFGAKAIFGGHQRAPDGLSLGTVGKGHRLLVWLA